MDQDTSRMLEECLKKIQELSIQHVRFEFYDLNLVARSQTVPSRHFRKCVVNGIDYPTAYFAFDTKGNLVEDVDFMKKTYLSNMIAFPDLSTFTVLPWVKDTARVFISAPTVDDGGVLTIDPRTIAMKQLKVLENRNLSLFSSFEFEFSVLDEKTHEAITGEVNICSTLRLAKHQEFFNKVSENLFKAGVDIERVETAWGKGIYEIPTTPAFGIQAADMAATLRTGVKEMAQQNGFIATFISMIYENTIGRTSHLNYSLWSGDGKTPLMCDPSHLLGLSEIGAHWIAGILEHIPALSALLAPTVNCRNMFKPGNMSALNATFGIDNRTCALRLKPYGPQGLYIEHRPVSSANNPYISLAAVIAAGLDGIDRKLPLPQPVPSNKNAEDDTNIPPDTKTIPKDLESALECLTEDEVLCGVFGPDFINAFISLKMHEKKMLSSYCKEKCDDVFKWAREFYMEYI